MNSEVATTPTKIIVTRYVVLADGKIIHEGCEESKALWFFLDSRGTPVKDLALVIKRRELPPSGQHKDIVW